MFRRSSLRLLSTLALVAPTVACSNDPAGPAEVAGPPPKLGLCASCHNVDGIATLPAHPHIAGQDAAYMRLAIARYRDGSRAHPPMRAAVNALTQADLDRIIDYYAALPRDGGGQ